MSGVGWGEVVEGRWGRGLGRPATTVSISSRWGFACIFVFIKRGCYSGSRQSKKCSSLIDT